MYFTRLVICLCLTFTITTINASSDDADNTKILRARLESCPSCKLNRLPGVRAFVYDDLPRYDNTEFKRIQGASPELLFLNDDDDVVERHSLEKLSREECNNLLQSRGFKLKDKKEL